MNDFPVHDCTQKQNSNPYFFPLFNIANGHLCQEGLLSSRNVSSMVMWHHTSLLHGTVNSLPMNDQTETEILLEILGLMVLWNFS